MYNLSCKFVSFLSTDSYMESNSTDFIPLHTKSQTNTNTDASSQGITFVDILKTLKNSGVNASGQGAFSSGLAGMSNTALDKTSTKLAHSGSTTDSADRDEQ